MTRILAALAAFFLCTVPLTARSMDLVQTYQGMNPQNTWINQQARDVQVGFGTFMWNAICGSSSSCTGGYANLSVQPSSGLYVTVAPVTSTANGALYQFLQEDGNALGGYPTGVGLYLPADPTMVMLQGMVPAGSNAGTVGALSPPGTGGQSVNYLIECAVTTYDTSSQSISIVSSGGSVTSSTGNRDRVRRLSCQSKAGTAATTGTQLTPTVDTGYIAIGTVAVPYGTSAISTGMITQNAASAYNGTSNAVLLSPVAQQTGNILVSGMVTAGTGIMVPINSVQTASTNQMTVGVDSSGFGTFLAQSSNGFHWGNYNQSSVYATLNSSGLNLAGNGVFGGSLTTSNVSATSGMTAGSSTYGPTSATVAGNITSTGNNTVSAYNLFASNGLTIGTGTGSGQGSFGLNVFSLQNALTVPTNINTNATLSATTIYCSLFGVGYNGVEQLCIDGSGNLGITGTLHQASTLKVKRNVKRVDPQWALKLSRSFDVISYCLRHDTAKQCGPNGDIRYHMSYAAEYTPWLLSGRHHNQVEPVTLAAFSLAAVKGLDAEVQKQRDEIAHLEYLVHLLMAHH